jgi:uncharacterized protein involved in exopolysaccharide biosynthesis
MPDLFDLLARWWKKILAVVLLSALVTGGISFFKPKKYLSVATALPASSYASDKAKVFNDNIQELYTALGTPDDLDAVTGIAALDTVYLSVTDQFNLYDHYKMKEKGEAARSKAAYCLKKNTKVYKSEYGNLKVKVWDTDKMLAGELANAIMDKLQAMYRDIQGAGNKTTLDGLVHTRNKLQKWIDSSYESPENFPEYKNRIIQYDKMINEYRLMVDSKPPSLIIVEKAKPALWPDKPKTIQVIIATAVLSFLFALLAALYLENRKMNKA